MPDLRYLREEGLFLDYSWDVYRDYFNSRERFLSQYLRITTAERKNLFLMVASSYKYLVRDCQYRLVEGGRHIHLRHLDNTYKFISLMSLIEALYAADQHVDFYEWLTQKNRRDLVFPISDAKTLETLYREYKNEFGTRKATRFFSEMDESARSFLAARIRVGDDRRTAIEVLAQKLYVLRSEFVHRARLILEFNEDLRFSKRGGDIIYSTLSLQDLQLLFEHGLLQRFGMIPDEKKI